jgi:aspartate/methionine/tyrosine aminotransferase
MNTLAARVKAIEPFHVMEILARAKALEASGRSIIHLEIGEPDFPTPAPIIEAGLRAIAAGHTHYAPATGLPALRAAIAESYFPHASVDPRRVVVTPGSSGALALVFAAILNPGDEVLLADPGYPCHRHFVHLFEGRAVMVPVTADTQYQLTPELIRQHWNERTRAVLVASPSNPTGTIVSNDGMRRLFETVRTLGGSLVADEIYHGLTYDADVKTALALGEDIFVVNSFSKYYGMTGWRVGWAVVPDAAVNALDKIAQNVFLATNTPAQHAALAAFGPETTKELERRRLIFRERRDYLLTALREIGFKIPLAPSGAFYLYADGSRFTNDSDALANAWLEQAGVAVAPGKDFGTNAAARHLRFSYATTLDNLREGVTRIRGYLAPKST